MIDTIEAKISVDVEFDTSLFTESSRYSNGTGTFERFVYQHVKPDYTPRLTYRRSLEYPAHGTLTVEFSVVKMNPDLESYNPNDVEIRIALDRVDRFLRVTLQTSDVKSVCDWRTVRMDCAYNFIVSTDLDAYMQIVQGLHCKSMSKQIHGVDGVTWVSRSRRRAIKFYNKNMEDTWHRWKTLRFEVSNYHSAVQYMCNHWFKCDRTVGACCTAHNALSVLHRIFGMLGLDQAQVYRSDEIESIALYRSYGTSSAQAQWILHMHRMMGVNAYKKGYTNQGTYYKWLKRLRVDGFITSDTEKRGVERLELPELWSINKQKQAQNLKKKIPRRHKRPLKM